MIEKRLLLLTLTFLATALVEAGEAETDAIPSLELLEYLAEFIEDDNGRLIDPMEAMDNRVPEEPDAHGVKNEWVNR